MSLIDRAAGASIISWCALVTLTACPLLAADVSPGVPVYDRWQTFTAHDGLPAAGIRALHVEHGRLWVGMDNGLAMYDGSRWESWTREHGLASPVVTALDSDPNTQVLWVGTWGGGLARFSAGRFDSFTQFNSGLAGDLIFSVRVVGPRVWVATNAGLCSFDPVSDDWKVYFERRGDTPESVVTSLTLGGKHLYAAGWGMDLQVFNREHDEWHVVTDSGLPARINLNPAGQLGAGAVGMTSAGGALSVLTQRQLLRRNERGGWGARDVRSIATGRNFVRCLAAPDQAEAWVGTNDGLHVFVNGLAGTRIVYRRCEGENGGIITVMRGDQVPVTIGTNSSIPDNRIRCIAFAGDDVWVGTAGGLARGSKPRQWSELVREGRVLSADAAACSPATPTAGRERGSEDVAALPESVTIGMFGPRAMTIALPGDDPGYRTEAGRPDLLAVQLAIDEANARGGYRGSVPVRLATGAGRYVRYRWGMPEDDFAGFLYTDATVGIVAYLGQGNVIRSAAAMYSEMPVVNVAPSPSATAGDMVEENPWVFRCHGDQPRKNRLLIDHLIDRMGRRRLALLRTPGRLAQAHLDWWSSHARRRGYPPVIDLQFNPEQGDIASVLDTLQKSEPDAILTWCDRRQSADILRRMREMGMEQLFVGSGQVISEEFVRLAGPEHGAVISLPAEEPHAIHLGRARFAEKYAERNVVGGVARPPGPVAYGSVAATEHLLAAIDFAGLDREALRQVLFRMEHTATGEWHYEKWEKPGEATLAVLQDGQWVYRSLR